MEKRLLEFIAGMRLAGVRISVAESEDAFRAVQCIDISDPVDFVDALRLTLIKRAADEPVFDELFPVYFGTDTPALLNLMASLSPQEQAQLWQAVEGLLSALNQTHQERPTPAGQPDSRPIWERLTDLQNTLKSMLSGQTLEAQAFAQAQQRAARQGTYSLAPDRRWRLQQRMFQQMTGHLWAEVQREFIGAMQKAGLESHQAERVMAGLSQNMDTLDRQVDHFLEFAAADQWTEEHERQQEQVQTLLHRDLQSLSERETMLLQREVRRLVAQIRSMMALRRKRGQRGTFDVRNTIRASLRYGGVPFQLKFKAQTRKPRLVLLCDISNSMRRVVEFALRLVYELQDQVSHVRTFTYIDTIAEVSQLFKAQPPEQAITEAMLRLPPRHPSTNLGRSLAMLHDEFAGVVDERTTVIIVGDACNSWHDPRLDMVRWLQQHSKAVIWFNPRPPNRWDTQDCDMLKYAPYARAVYQVSTLAQLTTAVEAITLP